MGIELFERAVSGGGQLLKAEVHPVAGRAGVVSAVLLTFDLGRISVTVEPATASLLIDYVDPGEGAPQGVEDASEEEPWWRVLGSPLARAWPAGPDHEGSVCLQFRGDADSPRIVTLSPHGGAVGIRLENPPAAQ